MGTTFMTAAACILACGVLAAGCNAKDAEAAKREYVRSGDGYVARNQLREAVVEYRNAVQQDARFGEARLKLANVYARLGEPANALREYVRAADLLPENADAQLRAGNALLLAGLF
jgi:cellulose synthase operon protein C